jgi:hypothetical protein
MNLSRSSDQCSKRDSVRLTGSFLPFYFRAFFKMESTDPKSSPPTGHEIGSKRGSPGECQGEAQGEVERGCHDADLKKGDTIVLVPQSGMLDFRILVPKVKSLQ